jgi:serpin B
MHDERSFRFVQKDGMTALEIPYKGREMSMVFLVPDAIDGLPALEASLAAGKLEGWMAALKEEWIALSLPKFEINPSESLSLGNDLKALGMPLAFDRDRANFTGIANPPHPADRLVIAKVYHKGFVRVDEEGTEAAAASAIGGMRAGAAAGGGPRPVRVDRPFLFLIRDNASGLVVFLGRVVDPTST